AAPAGAPDGASRAAAPAQPGFTPSAKPPLTAGQASALRAVEDARAAARGEVVLVDGVTGSGKTEVYLQAIEAVLREGRNAIVLVPEISLTPQTVARFRGRFGDAVAVMHSRMSQGERFDQWDFIRSGQARVVVGARSALFTPLADVGLIVIDEEHEGSYKQDSAPRYVARDVAAWMVRRSGGALVLGSATPSIEALHAAATDERWTQVSLPERANGRPLPAVEVIDMAAEFHAGSRSMFSRRLAQALSDELRAGRKAVLLLNQRGFAKFLLCRDCGFVPECPSCSTSLTYHEQGAKLVCHHCGYAVPAPPACPACKSPYLKKFGAGTQRVEAELRALLDDAPGVGPGVPIIRMDADTTRAKGAHQRLLDQFAGAGAAVLLGTQMIAKGLDFDDVTLVGVINADTQLHLPDYRAGERTFALIEQVAGRAGRAELPGRVLVQTYEASSVAIRAAATYDRALFLRAELPKRRMLGYPPYVRMANVLAWGADEAAVRRVAEELHAELEKLVFNVAGELWQVLPASPCVLSKLRGTYRWHVVVKCPREDDLASVLTRLVRARKADREVNVAVDVDCYDLL
ncbi:primosomal protein N', partial [Adlercreutzia sp. ZJ305]